MMRIRFQTIAGVFLLGGALAAAACTGGEAKQATKAAGAASKKPKVRTCETRMGRT